MDQPLETAADDLRPTRGGGGTPIDSLQPPPESAGAAGPHEPAANPATVELTVNPAANGLSTWPWIPAALSFVIPGAGQAAAGDRRRGLLLAIPSLVIIAGVLVVAWAGPTHALGVLLRPDVIVALLVLNVAFGAYHLLTVVDAYRIALPRPRRWRPSSRATGAAMSVLIAATLLLHGALGAVGYQTYQTLDSVFVGDTGEFTIPISSFDPLPAPSGVPTTAPGATPFNGPAWAADGRLNLLLIGSDAGPDRWSLRTDTMIVLSVDIETGRAAMFGIPRNMVGVPLPPESAKAFKDGRFPDLMNALYVYAMGYPNDFPGGETRGFRAVTGAIQELVGVPIDGVTVINLVGFVSLVNAIGGLWINIPQPLYDDHYPLETGTGDIVISIKAGCQRLNGRMALAYARSRHQDSDYGRMRRQQAVITALGKQVDPIAMLPRVSELLGIAKTNLWTTIAREDVADLAALAARVDKTNISTVTFAPPDYPAYLTTAAIAQIRLLVRTFFLDWEPAPTPTPVPPTLRPGQKATPTPRVTPSPKPTPTAKPSPTPTAPPAACP